MFLEKFKESNKAQGFLNIRVRKISKLLKLIVKNTKINLKNTKKIIKKQRYIFTQIIFFTLWLIIEI